MTFKKALAKANAALARVEKPTARIAYCRPASNHGSAKNYRRKEKFKKGFDI